jgi:hypothetical protein
MGNVLPADSERRKKERKYDRRRKGLTSTSNWLSLMV